MGAGAPQRWTAREPPRQRRRDRRPAFASTWGLLPYYSERGCTQRKRAKVRMSRVMERRRASLSGQDSAAVVAETRVGCSSRTQPPPGAALRAVVCASRGGKFVADDLAVVARDPGVCLELVGDRSKYGAVLLPTVSVTRVFVPRGG